MSKQGRDEDGRFTETVTDQDLLKAFDYATDARNPMLKVSEVADALRDHFEIDVTEEAIRQRLDAMEADGLVASKRFGARAVGWTALVAPELAPNVADRVESASIEDATPLDELDTG